MSLRVFLFVILAGVVPLASVVSAAPKGVSKNMETLAKALYADGGASNSKYIFDQVVTLEVGKNLGRGTPVKFRLKGIRGYQALSSPPPGWSSHTAVWVGDFIEAEQAFNNTFVVFYSKNEFGKLVACTNGGFSCVNEDNIGQYRLLLETMKKQHALAKAQDLRNQKEYAQRLINENAQRVERARLDQIRADASVPSETLGTYKCQNRYSGGFDDGELTLTDVDVSYIHLFPNEPPYQTKVIFSFDNIISAKCLNGLVSFALGREVWIRSGDRLWEIRLSDSDEADRFYKDLNDARIAWNLKHPDLVRNKPALDPMRILIPAWFNKMPDDPVLNSNLRNIRPSNNFINDGEGDSTFKTTVQKATVQSVKEAGGYTFIQVLIDGDDEYRWVATVKTNVNDGDIIEYTSAPPMKDFQSKSLGMTFKEIMFVSGIKNLEPDAAN